MAKLLPRLKTKWDALGDDVHRSLFTDMMSMSVPFWWHGPSADDPEIYGNGTLCLLDTGKRVVGVTAWHVWEGYRKRLQSGRPFVCQFGGVTVQPEALRIDHDKGLELATFDLVNVIGQMAGFAPHRLDSWPPDRPQVDDLMLYGGFPGQMRRADLVQATFQLDSVTGLVSQVTSQNIVIEVDYSRLHDADGPEGNVVAVDPAGTSGGAVYRIRETGSGHCLELAGFIYEQAQQLRFMLARPADFVLADGTLRR